MNLGNASLEDAPVQGTPHLRILTSSSSSEFPLPPLAFSSPTQTSFGLSEPPSPSDSSSSITSTPGSSACPFQTPSSSTSSGSVKPPHLDLGDSAFSIHGLRGPLKIEDIFFLLEQIELDHVNETQAIQAFKVLEKLLPDFTNKQEILETSKVILAASCEAFDQNNVNCNCLWRTLYSFSLPWFLT